MAPLGSPTGLGHLVLESVELGDGDGAVLGLPLLNEVSKGFEPQTFGSSVGKPARQGEALGVSIGANVGKEDVVHGGGVLFSGHKEQFTT